MYEPETKIAKKIKNKCTKPIEKRTSETPVQR
jgi:hypothetical protein